MPKPPRLTDTVPPRELARALTEPADRESLRQVMPYAEALIGMKYDVMTSRDRFAVVMMVLQAIQKVQNQMHGWGPISVRWIKDGTMRQKLILLPSMQTLHKEALPLACAMADHRIVSFAAEDYVAAKMRGIFNGLIHQTDHPSGLALGLDAEGEFVQAYTV